MNQTRPDAADPRSLSLDELRSLRSRLQDEDDAVSYVRRVAQGRLDLVRAETRRRATGGNADDLSGELRTVLSSQLAAGTARPPRTSEQFVDDELGRELEALCASHGIGRLEALTDAELDRFAEVLTEFERRVSDDRRERFGRLDTLSAELVRRYRDGEATVDGLLD